MNEGNAERHCFFCEENATVAGYGLCAKCAGIPARRRIYRLGRGCTPEWETDLEYLTERAKRKLPLFVEGYLSPQRPRRGRRKRRKEYVPRVFKATLPRKGREE
jgi:hypothetical protein